MSLRFDASGDRLVRTASLPDATAMTVCFWAKLSSDLNAFSTLWSYTGSTIQYLLLQTHVAGDNVALFQRAGGSQASAGIVTMTIGSWYFFGISISAATMPVYYGIHSAAALSVATLTPTTHTPTFTDMRIADNVPFGERADCALAAFKCWSGVAMTAAEIANERWSVLPQRTANLHMWTPLLAHTDVADYSGNGRDWTAAGTLSTEDGPPIGWRRGRSRILYPASDPVIPPPDVDDSEGLVTHVASTSLNPGPYTLTPPNGFAYE